MKPPSVRKALVLNVKSYPKTRLNVHRFYDAAVRDELRLPATVVLGPLHNFGDQNLYDEGGNGFCVDGFVFPCASNQTSTRIVDYALAGVVWDYGDVICASRIPKPTTDGKNNLPKSCVC